MKTPEEKIQFKNHFFKLGQGRLIPATDDRFYSVFWTSPRDATDIFDLLTAYDVQTVRDQNLPNMLVLIQVLIQKLSAFARGPPKKNHQEILNCVRFLAKLLPYLFELPQYHSDIEQRFFLKPNFDPIRFSTGGAPSLSVHARGSSDDSALGVSLVFSLVKLLFVPNFTVDAKAARADGSLCLWEPGLASSASYQPPDAIFDSHRSDILRLLLVLVSTTFYERVPNVVIRGSVFTTLLVVAVSKQDFLSLICSLTNLVCRSGRASKGDSGLEQDHASLVQSRLVCSALASQLLASMLVYAMPGRQYTSFLAENKLVETKPSNRVRAFFARLTKETDLAFLATHLLGVIRAPLVPLENSQKQKTYRRTPSPSALSALIMIWEIIHCNVQFGKLVAGRFAVQLVPCVLYHVFAFYDVPQHAPSVKVAAHFLLYLSSQHAIMKPLLSPMSDSLMEAFPPEFRVQGPISARDFVTIHACQILVALTANSSANKTPAAADMQKSILPALVECLYNMIPCTNPTLIGTDSVVKGLANSNPAGGLSYAACMSINQVLLLFASKDFLTKSPGNAEMLAFLLRALCAAATKTPSASRMLLLSFIEEEAMYNNIWNTIHALDKHYFCGKTSQLLSVQEIEEEAEGHEIDKLGVIGESGGNVNSPNPDAAHANMPASNNNNNNNNNDSADQVSIDSECSDETEPNSPNPTYNADGADGNNSLENSINEIEEREVEEALRPKPPAGMSKIAREKMSRDTPISVSWGGNEALETILIFLIPKLKEKLGDSWSCRRGSIQDQFRIVKMIENCNFAAEIKQHREKLHYDFWPDTPIPKLTVPWNYLSLGWYVSMLARDIFSGTESVRIFMGANRSLVGNISSSLAMFGKLATSWSGISGTKPVPARQDAAITEYVDANTSLTNVWAHTSVKLFRMRKPDEDRGLQAFGMRFGSVGSATSVNDITNSLVKRFSDFRGNNRSSVSSAGSGYHNIDEIPEGARLSKRNSVSSLHSLNTLNRARSNTPRNSMSN
ncbi:hypothetical protein OXX59_003162 [Metschnikowia pulcherrima]